MKYAKINKLDIANGLGCRVSLFTQGCNINCPKCFNKELWDINKGKDFIWSREGNLLLELLKPDYIKGLSILGGEPTMQAKELTLILNAIKNHYPNKDIWLWTGLHLDNDILNRDNSISNLLKCCDIVVDGPFIEDLKDSSLKFRGSSNQRILDIKKSIIENKLVDACI